MSHCIPESVGAADLLVTHIESLCYFWAQVANQETVQRMATLTLDMALAQLSAVNGKLQPNVVSLSLSLSLFLSVCLSVSLHLPVYDLGATTMTSLV